MDGLTSATGELAAAIAAARLAGDLLRQMFGKATGIRQKSPMEIVTEVDLQAEALIADRLRGSFPDYGFIGEEGGTSTFPVSASWIVDPIDGTTNFAHGYPVFSVSIALEVSGETVLGVVYNPVLDEMFSAEKGKGAYLNGERIHISEVRELRGALVASGFPYDAWTNPADNLAGWGKIVKRALSARCDGCASLDLCHVAAGCLDAYWEIDLEVWDYAAGALIVREAGGVVTSVSGELNHPRRRDILASNGHLHREMVLALRPD
jgi:myo-inositol-1(or 4)-monophosphatase